ncbi:sugar-binding transcriptional regulator [Clostridium sp. DJ247]|uniref:sugar-binding transcriptional regulator n=1 Tax=Clostridium sp. DJ247 TaxID=2726188 RepID=UPI001624169F|nr:sugar-binding domain-containing protein [Clostridium sp. DJ247]MBC2582064.1 sugar-binding transcriptional regulator [Clostridium sp. DJ247]
MEEVLKLQQKIVPELVELLEKRYNILRTIYYNQPIGRRVLANNLGIGERVVRTEINFLKSQNFIEISTPGMTITSDGEEIIDKLKDFIHELKGLSEIEKLIKESLGVKKVIIVPGNLDEDRTILNELGRAAANCLKSLIKHKSIIAVTGGSTIKEVIKNFPKISGINDILVVPARGGMGKNVETQSNTLAASLANKLDGSYKLLHVPDNLSDKAMSAIIQESDVKKILDIIYNANILLYGIGRAEKMARRRGLTEEEIQEIQAMGAVGEAFGYYFNRDGKIVYSTPSIGIKNEEIGKIETLIAVAGGKSKAEAIMSTELNHHNSILITDEGAAREIVNFLK